MTDTAPAEQAIYEEQPRKESMLKLMHLLRRRPELTLEQFQEHWLERHADFARGMPEVRRYVQYHGVADDPIKTALQQAADAPLEESYDGVAISWWESAGAMRRAMEGPAVAAALADEEHFIDHSRSVAVLTEEQVIVEPSGKAPIVLVECLRRQPTMTRSQFSERWLEHGHLGREANRRGLLQGYIQNHALSEDDPRLAELGGLGESDEPWDGVTLAYFDSLAVATELFRSPLASEEAYEDEREFIDHSKGLYLMARRHVIKDLVR